MLQSDKRLHVATTVRNIIREASTASGKRQEQLIRDAIDRTAELQAGLMTDLDQVRTHK